MTELVKLTPKEVAEKWSASTPLNRIAFLGVLLGEGCELPTVDINSISSFGVGLTIFFPSSKQKLELDGVIPWKDIPDATMSVREMACLANDLGEDAAEYALLTLVKQVARLKIEYGAAGVDEIEIVLSCGASAVVATCSISDLAGFVELIPGTREECEKRLEREVSEMPDFVTSSALSELRESFTGRIAPAPTLDE